MALGVVVSGSSVSHLRVPPHALEAEQSVLGGLLIDAQAWDSVAEKLDAQAFYRPAHQVIFSAMFSLAHSMQPIDVVTVSQQLDSQQQLQKIGGMAYLGELAQNTPTAANILAYADIVIEQARLRDLIHIGSQLAEGCTQGKKSNSQELIEVAEQAIFRLNESHTRGTGPEGITGIVARTLDLIEKRSEQKSPITGLATGFADFDRRTSGLQPGELIIIAGRPAMGKTLLAMNIAEYVAISSEKTALVFSMEMPGEALAMRMLSSLGRIEQHKLRTGALVKDDWERITHAVSWINKAKLVIDESPGLSPMEVRARSRRVAKEHPLGLIVVDYLQLMQVPERSDNRTAEISEISRSLKALAKELKVPVIALSQLNRSLEQRPNKRPVMSDLRESGAIEQDADLIAFIYRDEVYYEDSPDKGLAEIIIGKHRNGPIGTFRLTFLGQYTRFDNFAEEQAYQPLTADAE